MTTGATGQLGLALPVQGELSGTWGDTVNNGITQYTNIAIAGTLTLTGDGAVTLANTTGDASASNITSTLAGAGTVTAQFAIVKVSGTTTTKVVTGPSYSKTYVVDNASSFAVTFKASGQTGVSVAAAEKVTVVFNGTDYIKLAGTIANAAGSNTQIQFNNGGLFGASANLTWDGTTLSSTQVNITGQGTLRLQDTTGGEYVGLRSPGTLGASYTLTFPADDGTSGQALITDGSGVLSWSTAASGDVYGPASATNNGIVLFDGTTGKIIKDAAAQDGLIYGLTVGRGAGAVSTNTVVGLSALQANTTGAFNTAFGTNAGFTNTTGSRGTFVGYQAGYTNNGDYNTAVGWYALTLNTTGQLNTGVGDGALQANTTGSENSAVGQASLTLNTTGSNNTAVGRQALRSNTTASNNTAMGYQAAYTNSTGTFISALGYKALFSNTTGSHNAAVGGEALLSNTFGAENSAFGTAALTSNTTGNYNVAFGRSALLTNTTNSDNTAVGYQALNTTNANKNTAVGYRAGFTNSTGTNNVFIGNTAGNNATGSSNTFIGGGVASVRDGAGSGVSTGSKNVIIGNYSGSTAPISATGSNFVVLSDGDGNIVASAKTAQTFALQGAVPNSGTGITFPATQVASSDANTLDDYEEGTWTPSVGGTATYTAQTGTYTRIGRQVTLIFDMTILLLGTGSNFTITGLPFSAASQTGGSISYFGALATSVTFLSIQLNGSNLRFISTTTSSTTATNHPAIFGDSARVAGTVTYFV